MPGTMQRSAAADIVFCGLFAALTAAGAYIKIMIPLGIWEVTFSLQLLFSLLAGFLLGARRGLMSILVYLIIGLAGVPVFAHGGGPGYLLRPTFGFLIGFAAAAYVAGALKDSFGGTSFRRYIPAGILGVLAYYVCGLVYLYVMLNYVLTNGKTIGIKELFLVWFLSTAIPDLLLGVLAAYLAHRLAPALGGGRS